MKVSLKQSVAWLEDAIITISGPALAISVIIAGVDLVTGGNILRNMPTLTLVWAITLLLTLDFQVLALGVRAHRAALSTKAVGWRVAEIVMLIVIAAAISAVSIQMQSIIAVINAEGVTIQEAAARLGISMIALTWERSTLVLVLIFMSGWLREEGKIIQGTHSPEPLASPLQGVAVSEVSEENKPVQVPQSAQSRFESKEQAIWAALAANPHASVEELAALAQTTERTAAKWMNKFKEKAS